MRPLGWGMKPKMIPVSEAKRIADLAANRAFKLAVTIMIPAVADDGLYSTEDIQRLWHSINYKADSIRRGQIHDRHLPPRNDERNSECNGHRRCGGLI